MAESFSKTQRLFLSALAAGVRGKELCLTAEDASCAELTELSTLARAHKLLPLVFESVRRSPAAQNCARWQGETKNAVIRQVFVQTAASESLFQVTEALQKAGLRILCVKGALCRNLYPAPELRPSRDEDILVHPDDFPACCDVLGALGFSCGKNASGESPVLAFTSGVSPLCIELHKSLFPEDSEVYGPFNRFFSEAFEHAETYTLGSRTLASLSPTDFLLYLILHAYKHFVHSGFGVRQVCDIALWADRFSEQIDWERLFAKCRDARAAVFAAAVFETGRKYLGISPRLGSGLETLHPDPDPLLSDLLSAGVYGSSDEDRLHSSSVTLASVAADRKQKRESLAPVIFPGAKKLSARYPVLENHAYLLPFCWLHRLAAYGSKTLSARFRPKPGKSLKIARHRNELLRFYGIIG
ncbi:MAG: nucleotidyltransferase family protein [Clostridiales bacterium]|nr:nucleotidyltransferase family protein [Clostridiales bacterium]